jgi:alkylresorcinol/alkylpyrone synthase
MTKTSTATLNRRVRLAAVATASPPYLADQPAAEAFFTHHFAPRLTPRSVHLLRKFLAHPSIRRRHFAFDSPDCLVDEDPDRRIARFTHWAVELSAQAALKSMARAGLSPDDVHALVVNTCTGYLCPGLTSYLIERLALPRDIRAYDLVGAGCGGAVPNLQVGEEFLRARGEGAALCVAVEICSATFQMEDDVNLILSNALFADGAAAAVLWTRPQGLELVASGSRHAPEDREAIRYVHKRGQLYNQLSRSLPRLVDKAVAAAVQGVLEPRGLTVADVAHFALHGGGDKVITAVAQALGLSAEQLKLTRETMARYGNLSSPSVLFTLQDIMANGLKPGDWCLLATFGAGLSAHALLLRASYPVK